MKQLPEGPSASKEQESKRITVHVDKQQTMCLNRVIVLAWAYLSANEYARVCVQHVYLGGGGGGEEWVGELRGLIEHPHFYAILTLFVVEEPL